MDRPASKATQDGIDGSELPGVPDVGIPGRRTYLRPVEPTDAPLLRFLFNDPRVTGSVVGFNPPVSMEDELRWILSPRGGAVGPWHFTIVERASGRAVGLTSLESVDRANGTASDGIKLHPAVGGRGLAYDACMARNAWAFYVVGLRKLEALVLDFNLPAQRHFQRLGYRLEGRRREAVWRNGRWCDLLLYGLLRSDADQSDEMAEFRASVAPVSSELTEP